MATKKPSAKDQTAEPTFEPGQLVVFAGYPEGVPAEEQYLVAGESYEFLELADVDGTVTAFVLAPNSEFNEKKREHAETNPRNLEIGVLPSELTLAEDQGEAAEEVAAPAAEETAKPADATPAKPKTQEPAQEPADDEDEPLELEGEDETVLEMVGDGDVVTLIEAAQNLESEAASAEYRMGGVLFHLHNGKVYQTVTDAKGKTNPVYAEKGGWKLFLMDHFNLDYRKAMDLIGIYVNFTLAGVPDPAERVAAMGWSKAAKVAKYLTDPDFVEGKTKKQVDKHVKDLLKLADETASADLFTAIKDTLQIDGGDSGGGQNGSAEPETRTRVTLRYRFFEADAKLVEESLAQAQEISGQPDANSTLLYVLGEFLAQHAPAATGKGKAGAKDTEGEDTTQTRAAPGRRARASA